MSHPRIAIYEPRQSAPDEGRSRPWRVRRKVDGIDRSSFFKLQREAWKYYQDLVSARNDGLEFDPMTGEPRKWCVERHTVAEWAQQWITSRADALKPRTRASYIEALAEVLPHLVHPRAPRLTDESLAALRTDTSRWLMGIRKDMPEHLRRYSVNLPDLAASGVCLAADTAIRTGRGGKPRSAQTVKRYRVTINTLLNDAVERKLLDANPWPTSRARTVKERTHATRTVSNLPSDDAVRAAIKQLSRKTSAQTAAIIIFSRLAFEAGLRPAEARALHVEDVYLPSQGWGEIHVVRSVNDGPKSILEGVDEYGPTKTGATRRVPIHADLVEAIRAHVGPRTEGLVAQGRDGKPVSHSAWARAWRNAREDLDCTIYELRHVCATRWLKKAGVANIAEVARRLGHSPEVLLSIYVGVVDGDEEHVNDLLAS